ncbi:ATP-binding protein [Variovorax sp. J22G73]|uniref:ATP-binding protein n=1 Tax=unclassified Variovorax TaxID=663243 RepID=UPI00257721EF|nr:MULTISPECIES: ATP-binding protein [unclassified Variovorax]MDM0007239.1 ATP-binding protein [Variovorax sp. J22R203]MDM0099009.1 ATP-binding protein [Variovorax sp. J22G73]
MNPQGTARRWPGPPLALQIMGLLLGGLVVAQGVTLALTMLLPPEPQRQWELGDIARVLSGHAAEGRNANLLQRSLQARAPEPKGQGWLTSERSRRDLAQLMTRDEADVRLYFYTPLPFAGTTGPVADAGTAGAIADAGETAQARPRRIAATFAGGGFVRVQAGGAPAMPAMPGGPGGTGGFGGFGGAGGTGGGFGIGRGTGGSIGGFQQPSQAAQQPQQSPMTQPSQTGGVTGAVAAPATSSAPTTATGNAPGNGAGNAPGIMTSNAPGLASAPTLSAPSTGASPGITAAPSLQAAPAQAGPSIGNAPGGLGRTGPATLAPPAMGSGLPMGPAMQPAPSIQAPPPIIDTLPPRKAASTTEAPVKRTAPAPDPPAPHAPTASTPAEPTPRASTEATRPPRSTEAPRTPPTTDTTTEVARPAARGLFGLAPAPFVEGDFIAAVYTREGSWVVVQPVPESFPNAWQRRVLLWFLMAAVIVAPAGWLFSRRLVRPLSGFARAADQLGRDPSAPVLALEGPAEIGRAAQAFNRMQARLRSFVDDRTVMIGAISHDLRTPLTRLRFRIEDVPDDVRAGMLDDVEEMERMIGSVLSFIRDASVVSARERMDLASLVEDVVEQAVFVGKDVLLQRTEHAQVEVDAMGMRRVLDNLVENAVKYGHQARVRLFTDGADAVVEISDRGPGLPADELERVFKPFYRSPQARASRASGSGLGLAVCRSIARAHGGDVVLRSGPHGLLAQVRVPLALQPQRGESRLPERGTPA